MLDMLDAAPVTRRSFLRRHGPAAATIVAAAVLVLVLVLILPDRAPTPTAAQAPPAAASPCVALSDLPRSDTAAPSIPRGVPDPALLARVQAVRDARCPTPGGQYASIHLRAWSLPAGPAARLWVDALDIRCWAVDDAPAFRVVLEAAPDYTLAGVAEDHRNDDREFATATPIDPARLSLPAFPAQRWSSRPDELAAQITTPDDRSLTAVAYGIEELYTWYDVPVHTRAAVIDLLAKLPGVTYAKDAVDRHGRRGFVVSVESRRVLYSFIFDPASGALLAAQHRRLGRHPFLAVDPDVIEHYALFLDQGRSDDKPRPATGSR